MLKATGIVAIVLTCAVATPLRAEDPPPGMASYFVGLLVRGAHADGSGDPDLQRAHIASLERRWREGTLVGAGPVGEDGRLRGLLLIVAPDADRARAIAADDPAVKAGRLDVEVHPWWGPRDVGAAYKAAMEAHPAAKPKMRAYQLAFLRRGPSWAPGESPEHQALQERHMAHIREMAASGALVAAGPFLDDGELRGIFVFATDAADAQRRAAEDPAVHAGRLALEFHEWWLAEGVMPAPH